MVLGPVAALLGNKRLVIVSDGSLSYIPFGAMPAPVAGDRGPGSTPWPAAPLIIEHEITRLPSASVLTVLRREASARPSAAKSLAVLADPVFDQSDPRVRLLRSSVQRANRTVQAAQQASPDATWARERLQRSAGDVGVASRALQFARLPFTRREAKAIRESAPEGTAREALDFEASRATAMSPELSQYRMIHFATHGLVDSERPELSGLVLSLVDQGGNIQNGFLQLQDISNMNLNADLVVLSGCQTALGKDIKGEGFIALARGFMYAGARRVVASLWKVDDSATAELMARFYAGMLKDGKRPAAALRDAQIRMWEQKHWSSPYYWSAFEIQGEWR
jgi:CHAT domain-containing protein